MNERVRVLFHELSEIPPAERAAHYVKRRVSAEVRAEVESLLAFDTTTGPSLTSVLAGAAEQLLMAEAPVGDDGRCGSYRLVRMLGNGGMGAVYLAERADGEVEQRVAIKFLRADADAPAFRERFLKERQILASLNHPGIARLLDAGHAGNQPYLVMEYVDGLRIDAYAEGRDSRSILELILRVADAVSYAHRNLVIHRDLKPSNILVESTGEPKLLDFGIAKLMDEAEQTRTIDRLLTPEYASPEQQLGTRQTTTTDVYSLAAVLHRLLTGQSHRISGIDSSLPTDLQAILGKALRDEAEERYASVDLFCSDIRAYLHHRPVQARRGNTLYLVRKFIRRRWAPIAAATLAITGLTGGLLIAERERAVAERRFEQVRALSKQFFELDSEIRTLPGSTKARHRIVSASLEYLARLGAEASAHRWGVPSNRDLDLALDIGAGYLQVARVQGVPTSQNLGRYEEAKRSLERADQFVDMVLASHGYGRRRAALLTSAEISRARAIISDDEQHEDIALAATQKAVARLEELIPMTGKGVASKQEAAAAANLYTSIALTRSNMHRIEEAAEYARRAVVLARVSGDDKQLSRGLGVLSNTARFAGDLDGALVAIRESRQMAEATFAPNDAEATLRLCGALWREGLVLGEANNISLDRVPEAIPLLERALRMSTELAQGDARDYASRSYVSMAARELGDILRDRDPARALQIYDDAYRMSSDIPGNEKARRSEVWLLTGSSYALRKLGRTADAKRRLDAAVEVLRKLKGYPAPRAEVGQELDTVLRAEADHYAETGQIDQAIRAYEDLYEKLQAGPSQPESDLRHANGIARVYRELVRLHHRAGHLQQAASFEQQRVELWRYWDQKLPNNPFIRRQLTPTPLQ